MSKTPRTDAEFKLEAFFDGAGVVETVLVEFAEQLETELADKDKLIEQMGRAMEKVIANYRVNLRDLTDFENKQVATLEAALAAERGE